MKKKLLCLVLAALLCLSLSGCAFTTFDAKNLMAPPKVNEDQQAIHRLLQGDRQDITFLYPKSGSYRSAIIMQDFTGDGQKDAIGFYSLVDTGGVEVQFLTKAGSEWSTVAVFNNTALQVDRVLFGDLTGSGHNSVLIGWGSASGASGRTATVNAYLYDDGEVSEYTLGVYSEMALTDFDNDGQSEIFTVDKFLPAETEGDEPSPAVARVYAWNGAGMGEVYSTDADNSIASYSSAAFGHLTTSLHGVVLDGAKADGSMTSQLFFLEDDRLVNYPGGVNTEEYTNPFARPSTVSLTSRDINGDGTLNVPKVSLLPCLPEDVTPDSTCYVVEWQVFHRLYGSRLAVRSLVNSAENYWFPVPYALNGRLTAANDPTRRTVVYSEAVEDPDTGEKHPGGALFSIRVFTRATWESRGQSIGFEYLASQNDLVYGIQPLTQDPAMLRYVARIQQEFRLLGE